MSPTNRTVSRASHGRCMAGGTIGSPAGSGSRSRSSAVYTATTPGASRAAEASTDSRRPCATCERTNVACTAPVSRSSTRSRARTAALAVAIVAVALNQRPAVVAVAPVLGDLRTDTGLSAALAGLLTTVPVLCFGAFAPSAPRLARRIGLETAVGLSLLLLAAGIALRLLPPVVVLYAGSLIAGAAIAFANVLLPAFVKREFSRPGA